ncbi:MAG: sugar phosphate isomerase/epimerase family protein [Planctomycetota bacterium]|jgi:sugar phosphate isomerase/epimerase
MAAKKKAKKKSKKKAKKKLEKAGKPAKKAKKKAKKKVAKKAAKKTAKKVSRAKKPKSVRKAVAAPLPTPEPEPAPAVEAAPEPAAPLPGPWAAPAVEVPAEPVPAPAPTAEPAPEAETKAIPMALQLYSVRYNCETDLDGVLERVARMGYVGVEFAGYYGRSAEALKALLDRCGLAVAGTHIRIDTLLGEEFQKTVEFNKTIGNRFLIVPGLPEEYRNSADAWRRTADVFNFIAERAAAVDMRVGYHNHHIEFQPMDGELPWDIFFSRAKPEVVMQLDTGNALHGGADPVPFVERYPGRATTVHLKEHSATNDKALIGEGDIRWADIFRLCETVGGTEWYIVEQESYAFPPMECVAKCREALRGMGK